LSKFKDFRNGCPTRQAESGEPIEAGFCLVSFERMRRGNIDATVGVDDKPLVPMDYDREQISRRRC
jgi:hypothetical protein